MRAGDALAAMGRLPMIEFGTGFGDAAVLVMAPHPDDESLGCGGLIAEACRRGVPPVVVVLTDGAMSHPGSRRYPRERLRRVREEEALEAVALLGLPSSRTVFMGCPDTAAPARGPALAQMAAWLAEIIAANRCGTVVASWEHDPHCDHLAAARIARVACRMTGARLLAYPVWGRILPPSRMIAQNAVRGFRLDVRRHLGCKRAAIMAHRSQYAGLIDDDPGGFQLEAGFVEQFLTGEEVFLEADEGGP
jgi:LmbE family N-acetylglucosaminyl deacetylase